MRKKTCSTGVIAFLASALALLTDIFASGDFAGGSGIGVQAFVAFGGEFAVGHLAHFGIAVAGGNQIQHKQEASCWFHGLLKSRFSI